jgi:signal transduction histidine kinase
MRKVAVVFILAVVVPSLVLAGLALRSLRDQRLATERQETLLAEAAATELARKVEAALDDTLREFSLKADALIGTNPPSATTPAFDERLRSEWPAAAVGFVVTVEGSCISPSLFAHPEARKFRIENERFLCNAESVEVVWNSPKGKINLTELDLSQRTKSPTVFASSPDTVGRRPARNFRDIIGDSPGGSVARFVQDELQVLLWHRHPADPGVVFGAQVRIATLIPRLAEALRPDPALAERFTVLLRDDSQLVAAFAGTEAAHRTSARPIAAADIGDKLPHWRVEIHPSSPGLAAAAVHTQQLTIALLVGVLLVAMGVGSWLIVTDLQRHLLLAQQKTDFVSNVSHELKTPLTSIRMFAELLDTDAPIDPARQRKFVQVIQTEASRLTRLLDNVLDFGRLEQKRHTPKLRPTDIPEAVRNAAETCRPQLEAAGVRLQLDLPQDSLVLDTDPDAIAQVLFNLLSNVEKYAASGRVAEVAVQPSPGAVRIVVSDRGPGIPAGCEERIFEQFFRAHDSLASGIPGSGLGLALARRLVELHRGTLVGTNRPEGGARFVVTLPRVTAQPTP